MATASNGVDHDACRRFRQPRFERRNRRFEIVTSCGQRAREHGRLDVGMLSNSRSLGLGGDLGNPGPERYGASPRSRFRCARPRLPISREYFQNDALASYWNSGRTKLAQPPRCGWCRSLLHGKSDARTATQDDRRRERRHASPQPKFVNLCNAGFSCQLHNCRPSAKSTWSSAYGRDRDGCNDPSEPARLAIPALGSLRGDR